MNPGSCANRTGREQMAYIKIIGVVILAWGTMARPAAAARPSCTEQCEAQRKQLFAKLKECLAEVEPRPKDRAAKMRLLCRKKYQAPRCEGLPPCKAKKEAAPAKPRIGLGAIQFSRTRRGPGVKRPSYSAGKELFMSLKVEIVAKPAAKRVWLLMDLRVLTMNAKGKERELYRWEKYFNERKFLDPAERGLPKQYTIHGGAQLPVDMQGGSYVLEAQVTEKESGLKETVRGIFRVAGSPQGRKR